VALALLSVSFVERKKGICDDIWIMNDGKEGRRAKDTCGTAMKGFFLTNNS
jgi:hypothetical protein